VKNNKLTTNLLKNAPYFSKARIYHQNSNKY